MKAGDENRGISGINENGDRRYKGGYQVKFNLPIRPSGLVYLRVPFAEGREDAMQKGVELALKDRKIKRLIRNRGPLRAIDAIPD